MKIERRLPMEQYGYYNVVFDSMEELKKEFKNIKNTIKEVEDSVKEKEVDTEFEQQGSFMKRKDK